MAMGSMRRPYRSAALVAAGESEEGERIYGCAGIRRVEEELGEEDS